MRARWWLPALGIVVSGLWLWSPLRGRFGAGPIEFRSGAPLPDRTMAIPPSPPAPDTPGASARRAAEPSPDEAAVTCRIRVVRAGVPEPAARLWLQRDEVEVASPEWKALMTRFNDVEPVLAGGLGHELTLDANGAAQVPAPGRRLCLAAARDEWHGEAVLEPGQHECVVELTRQHSLAIEVLDGTGRPVADAFVVLSWGAFDPIDQRRPWKTDADGRVAIVKVENQVWPAGHAGPLRLSMGGGAPAEPDAVLFTFERMPPSPVRFVLGPHGSLRVQLVDRNGREVAQDGDAELWQMLATQRDPSLSERAGAELGTRLVSGSARFDGLGLERFFEPSARAEGHLAVWGDAERLTRPGEEKVVRVLLGQQQLVARGLLAAIPAGFADRRASLRLTGDGPNMRFQTLVEEGGAFEAKLWGWPMGEIERPWSLALDRAGGALLHRAVAPSLDEARGVLDFGEIAFDPAPLEARLVVVDEAGNRVPGASIEIRTGAVTDRVTCDPDGRCRMAAVPAQALDVRATHATALASDWTRITDFDLEHKLALGRGAQLSGQLLLASGALLDEFEVRLRSADAEADEILSTWLLHDGRFRFENCPTGRFFLEVEFSRETVHGPVEVELEAGQSLEWPPIDLRRELHAIELHFALASGEPWTRGHLEAPRTNGAFESWFSIGPEATAILLSRGPALDLWVAGRGARPRYFEGVRDGDLLTLPAAPSVLLRLPRDIVLPPAPLVLLATGTRVRPEEVPLEPEEYDDIDEAIASDDGTVRFRPPWPGDYELEWFVCNPLSRERFAVATAPEIVAVTGAVPPPTVPVGLTRIAVERAVLAASE